MGYPFELHRDVIDEAVERVLTAINERHVRRAVTDRGDQAATPDRLADTRALLPLIFLLLHCEKGFSTVSLCARIPQIILDILSI